MLPSWEAWLPPINPTVPDLYQGTLPGTLTWKHAGERVCSEPNDAARGIAPDRCPSPMESLGKTGLEPATSPLSQPAVSGGRMTDLAEMFPYEMFAAKGKHSKWKKISY